MEWHLIDSAETDVVDDLLNSILNTPNRDVPDTCTENGALALSSTGSVYVDLFSSLVRKQDADKLISLITKCWALDPVRAVQMIKYSRDCRNALGERDIYRTLVYWLRANYPRTYLRNLKDFIAMGYYKDLLMLVKKLQQEEQPKLGVKDFVELEVLGKQLASDEKLLDECLSMEIATDDEDGLQERKMKMRRISLAAKWAPSEKLHFDKHLGVTTRLAKLMFTDSKRDIHHRYRKSVGRLRKHLRVVERLMCSRKWGEINYEGVPSKAQKLYRKAFTKHDGDRYRKYLGDVAAGKAKVNTTGLQPDELVREYITGWGKWGNGADPTIEVQWSEMIRKLKSAGKFSSTLAVVDVSGSMAGQPMEVAIALGLVACDLTEGEFHRTICTFAERPTLVRIEGETLVDQVRQIQRINAGLSTNFEAVFNLLLEKAQREKIPKDRMVKTVICFTDMQFNAAHQTRNSSFMPVTSIGEGDDAKAMGTLYQVIKQKYEDAGYDVPNFVFWNLRASKAAFPVTATTPGTALVSGYSSEILKMFMDGQNVETFNPLVVVENALNKYSAVIDPSEIGIR